MLDHALDGTERIVSHERAVIPCTQRREFPRVLGPPQARMFQVKGLLVAILHRRKRGTEYGQCDLFAAVRLVCAPPCRLLTLAM